jgi:hypothetical protein
MYAPFIPKNPPPPHSDASSLQIRGLFERRSYKISIKGFNSIIREKGGTLFCCWSHFSQLQYFSPPFKLSQDISISIACGFRHCNKLLLLLKCKLIGQNLKIVLWMREFPVYYGNLSLNTVFKLMHHWSL